MNTGLALWFIFEFVFSLYFVFLKFWVCIFFVLCIFEIVDSYFFCIFCIFEIRIFLYFLYLSRIFFGKNTQKNTKKIQIEYKKTLCIFVFLHYVQKCNLYFCMFFVFFQSFTDCTLSFCIFSFFRHAVKEQNRESINVCCIFLLLMIFPHYCCIVFVIWTCIFCIFCIGF